MTDAQRGEVLNSRKLQRYPWHSPPHRAGTYTQCYLLSAACYEHKAIIGKTLERMSECEEQFLTTARQQAYEIFAWCLLPNHYHILLQTDRILELIHQMGRLHGRLSHQWNGEDAQRGRKVWFNCVERTMKSERHFWATLNYVHHNPVHHGYVDYWQDWPFSSGMHYLNSVGRQKAMEIWNKYPILDYGKKWDAP